MILEKNVARNNFIVSFDHGDKTIKMQRSAVYEGIWLEQPTVHTTPLGVQIILFLIYIINEKHDYMKDCRTHL